MTAKQPTADKSAATTVKKTVTVNAYAPDFGSDREFANALDGVRDYFDTKTASRTDYYLNIGDYSVDLSSDAFRRVRDEIDAGANVGEVTVEERQRSTQEYRYRPINAPGKISDRFADTVGEFDGLHQPEFLKSVWKNGDGDWMINIRNRSLEPRRVLAHHDVRTSENRYEGDGKVMSAQWSIALGPASEAEVEEWNERITGPFAQFVAEQPAVQKVRIADCKERVEKKGDCFDI